MNQLTKNIETRLKEHPREKERDKRKKNRDKERERQYQKLLDEWNDKEKQRIKDKEREKERESEKTKQKQKKINEDLQFDPVAEKKRKKKNPDYFKRLLEERKKYRDQEREDDEVERKKEEETKAVEELKRIQLEEEIKKKKEWEEKNVFTKAEEKLQTEYQPQQNSNRTIFLDSEGAHIQSDNMAIDKLLATQEVNQTFKMEDIKDDEADQKKKKQTELPKLAESTEEAMNKIEAENRVKSQEEEERLVKAQKILEKIDQDDDVKKQVELAKKLYEKIPTRKNELFKYPVNWEIIEKSNIYEKKLRPWVANRIKDLLGSEEEKVINLIVTKVKKKCPPQEIEDKVETFLEKEAEEFVVKMWKLIVFEQLKIENNI